MAITFPLTPPTFPGFTRFELIQRVAVSRVASPFTGQQQVSAHQGGWWELSATLPFMVREVAAPWIAFLHSLNGAEGTFLMGDPLGRSPLGNASGSPQVKGASQTGKALITDTWTANTDGVLLAGDYYQLGSGATTRLYTSLQNLNTDGSGDATIDGFPRLRESPADNEALVLSNPRGTFRLAQNTVEISSDSSRVYSIGFGAVEAF